MTETIKTTKAQNLAVECPKCTAGVGLPCMTRAGATAIAVHPDRVKAAAAKAVELTKPEAPAVVVEASTPAKEVSARRKPIEDLVADNIVEALDATQKDVEQARAALEQALNSRRQAMTQAAATGVSVYKIAQRVGITYSAAKSTIERGEMSH